MIEGLDREDLLEPEHLSELTAVVLRVLDEWGLDSEQQSVLLGFPLAPRRRRARQDAPLRGDRETLQRLSYLLTIERAVRTAFPHNVAMARYWVTTPHPLFEDRTPVDVMLASGMEGMEQVVRYLTCRDQW